MQVTTLAQIKFKIKTITTPHDDMQDLTTKGACKFVKHFFVNCIVAQCHVKNRTLMSRFQLQKSQPVIKYQIV